MLTSSYSPSREGCGMMQLHSPTSQSTYDAIREIRRSLSRSPSKPYNFRSSLQAANTPYQHSPLSPSRRSTSDNCFQFQTLNSPYATRSAQPNRIQRPMLRRTAQTVSSIRTRTSPKSPVKRNITENNDPAPTIHFLRKRRSAEIEEDLSFLTDENKENRPSPTENQILSWKTAQTKQEKRRSGGLLSEVSPLSPMKRTDVDMSMDEPDFQSPNPKRRSMHGPSSAMDFSIFESDLTDSEKRAQDDHDWFRNIPTSPSTRFQTIPRRSTSLRKSTLQQRQSERSSPLRLNNNNNFADLRQNSYDTTPKKTFRSSLNLPPEPRDSPFSAQGDLLNASIHPMVAHQEQPVPATLFRHPLANTITQSSSVSSIQDDSPTHEPPRRADRSKSHDFSKSLPLGALRPQYQDEPTPSSQASFATPANFKAAKPLPAAFMSTGLISKKNRNVNEIDAGLPKAHMPDTPCKKQTLMFPPPKDASKPSHPNKRSLQTSTMTPRSPAEVSFGDSRIRPFPFSRSTGLFTNKAKQSLARKASFASLVSIDVDEKPRSQSPSLPGTQSTDGTYPPTPTKADLLGEGRLHSVSPSPQHVTPGLDPSMTNYVSKFASSKSISVHASPTSTNGDSDGIVDESPSTRPQQNPLSWLNVTSTPAPLLNLTCRSRPQIPSSPVLRRSGKFCYPSRLRKEFAKALPLPVSPSLVDLNNQSPQTPCESLFPVCPSSLSISGKTDRPITRNGYDHFAVPATPTGPKEYFANFSNRPSLNLNAPELADIDASLAARFDKVDLVGTGEFSQVYRVSEPPQSSPFPKLFGSSRPASRSSLPGKVWAVKKSRHPYSGPKDRARKVHEVDVLKTLGQNEHILHYHDSWEDNAHLYIQTEFCEEGTLDVFLGQAGLKARLDDFRIWKILLELSLGLSHIHDMGFIHLDLKPANILITFEGVLRIGDFGMATKWPAKPGIEGEGDREYIGPEVLMGRYDKPADVFALGLIMLETAGNVELPDNGASWQKLRNGDMSDVPSLTFSSADSNILRDASGNPMTDDDDYDDVHIVHSNSHDVIQESDASKVTHMLRRGELIHPPLFMTNPEDHDALDQVVRWMISPDPDTRPKIERVLQSQGVQWVQRRRRAGATIFEGNWGPADEMLAEDSEMIDV